MRKFRYDDGTEGVEYETLDELLELPNIDLREYKGVLYANIIEDPPYFNTIYTVDTKTRKVSYYGDKNGYMIDIYDNATPVDPEEFRKRVL